MTREEILAMKPGKELDELVGQILKVTPQKQWQAMNKTGTGYYMIFDRKHEANEWHERFIKDYPKHPYSADGGHIVEADIYHNYSTDISAAWEVVEKMREMGKHYFIRDTGNNEVLVQFSYLYGRGYIGETAPEAICKAALLALVEEQ